MAAIKRFETNVVTRQYETLCFQWLQVCDKASNRTNRETAQIRARMIPPEWSRIVY
jgi:hypothetical protein